MIDSVKIGIYISSYRNFMQIDSSLQYDRGSFFLWKGFFPVGIILIFYTLRLYLNNRFGEDYEILFFASQFTALLWGVIVGFSYKNNCGFLGRYSRIKNDLVIPSVSLVIFAIISAIVFFVVDQSTEKYISKIADSLVGGFLSSAELAFIFFIGYIASKVSQFLMFKRAENTSYTK